MSQYPLASDLPIADKDRTGLTTYIEHAVAGVSIRQIARQQGVHPSTVMRRVRKFEHRREDPLVDEAIDRLTSSSARDLLQKGNRSMPATASKPESTDKKSLLISALSQLQSKGAFLVVASDLEDAAIMKSFDDGEMRNQMTLCRSDAMLLALNDWVELMQKGRMNRYRITSAGKKALKRMLAERRQSHGMAEAPSTFAHQHIEWGTRVLSGDNFGEPVHQRVNVAESPVTLLARRKDRQGKAFLNTDLVCAGERLREDFELSQMGPRITQNWDSFLTGPNQGGYPDSGIGGGSSSALKRFRAAMKALGPGLSDIALECCCMMQGLEIAEKKLGWSARSGKVVLKIALQRLHNHYQEIHGSHGPMIG